MVLSDAEKGDVDPVPSAMTAAAAADATATPAQTSEAAADDVAEDPAASTKKRGREPSPSDAADAAADSATVTADDAETEEEKEAAKKARVASPPPKKKVGRPPKKKPAAGPDDKAAENPKKRKAGPKKSSKDELADEGEETESEPEKQPKKRAKPAAAAKEKKSPARRKKQAKEVVASSDSEDTEQQDVERRVDALDPDVKAKFGSIVWAKMVGFPFWPAMITDPRLLPSKLQASAMEVLETKYFVYFYATKNFAPTLFKNIAPWDDTKNDYRSGFPAKDAKAPKRRAQLMEAIAEADKDLLLPIEERVNGLLKPSVEEPKPKKSAPKEDTGHKRGKQLGPLTARKSGVDISKASTERKTARKSAVEKEGEDEDEEDTVDEPSQESHEEDDENPVARTLSKDEIKAKVASRKTPSKKKMAGDDAETKTKAGGPVKKVAGGAGKSTAKASSGSNDIDTKRKKEIELVVPRKSVKSADIREMTEEAAKKSLSGGAKDKTKSDKGGYKVGDLNSFASKLTRLHLNESAKNNDEIIRMLTLLFEEKPVYRSDVESSGIASIIARLRKSSNPTVAQTASAVRKHMIAVIVDDTGPDGDKSVGSAPKAAAGASETDSKAKKPKEASKASEKKNEAKKGEAKKSEAKSEPEATAQKAANAAKKVKSVATDSDVKKESAATASDNKPLPKGSETLAEPAENKASDKARADSADSPPTQDDKGASAATSDGAPSESTKDLRTVEKTASGEDTAKVAAAAAASKETGSSAAPAAENRDSSVKKADASLDAHRQAFIDMLSSVLDPSGAAHVNLAKEIEEFVFDRYKESNDDYRVQARKITFGLKKNTNLRERLISGALHGLELVYADDKFFEASP